MELWRTDFIKNSIKNKCKPSLKLEEDEHIVFLIVILQITTCIHFVWSGLGIYQRKKENKKTRKHARVQEKKNLAKKTRICPRKHALIQESVHEKNNSLKKTCIPTRKE